MSLPELLEYVKAGGGLLAPVFAILWWLERDERKGAQTELKQVSHDATVAMIEMKAVVGQLATIFKPMGQS